MNGASKLLLSLVVGGLAVGGCAVGPNYHEPKTKAPPAFGEAHNGPTTQPVVAVDLTQWWTTFNDPELNSLIQRSVASNLTLLSAEARVRQARAQLGIERAELFPMVSVDGAASKSRASKNTVASGTGGTFAGNPESELYQGGFDAGWEIDVFGGTRRSIEAASADLYAQVDARRFALVTLLGEVAHDYVTLRGLQRQLALTYSNLKSQQDTVSLTQSRFKAGLDSDLDVAEAEANVATTAADVPTLEIQVQQTIHQLSILLGEEPMALAAELEKDTPIPPTPLEIPVGLPSDLLRRRPDVMEAERQLAESTANIGVAVANLFPKFSLTGSLGQQSARFGLIARADSTYWSIGPTVTWNVFNANQLVNQVRVSNALQQQALLN